MKAAVSLTIDTDSLPHVEDETLAMYWHVSQLNPAPFGDIAACGLAEAIRTEILRRWLRKAPVPLHSHQAHHVDVARRLQAQDAAAITAPGGAA